MKQDLPQELIHEVQKYTNAPWWNGEAYVEYHGLGGKMLRLRQALDFSASDIRDVMEILRERKDYGLSDRLRTIADRMSKASDDHGP